MSKEITIIFLVTFGICGLGLMSKEAATILLTIFGFCALFPCCLEFYRSYVLLKSGNWKKNFKKACQRTLIFMVIFPICFLCVDFVRGENIIEEKITRDNIFELLFLYFIVISPTILLFVSFYLWGTIIHLFSISAAKSNSYRLKKRFNSEEEQNFLKEKKSYLKVMIPTAFLCSLISAFHGIVLFAMLVGGGINLLPGL